LPSQKDLNILNNVNKFYKMKEFENKSELLPINKDFNFEFALKILFKYKLDNTDASTD
jgi:hypothetical protein